MVGSNGINLSSCDEQDGVVNSFATNSINNGASSSVGEPEGMVIVFTLINLSFDTCFIPN